MARKRAERRMPFQGSPTRLESRIRQEDWMKERRREQRYKENHSATV